MNNTILACGGELKNRFCILDGKRPSLYLGPLIGDLEDADKFMSYEKAIVEFERELAASPGVIAYDMHPEYLSTKYALGRLNVSATGVPGPAGLPAVAGVAVQHHYAHSVACLADSLLLDEISDGVFDLAPCNPEEKFIGVAFDGLGFGDDGALWGAEFLVFDLKGYRRALHLEYVPLPGGAAAVREPSRMGCVYLRAAFGDSFETLDIPFTRKRQQDEVRVLNAMADKGINSPKISSMGRLFDAVSAIAGIRDRVDYEAQAAIELEKVATNSGADAPSRPAGFRNPSPYEFAIENGIIKAEPVIRAIVKDIKTGIPAGEVALKFHLAVSGMIADACKAVKKETGVNRVTLSGGVFQNRLLFDSASSLLRASGFDLHTHKHLSPNDSSICVGQAVYAHYNYKR